MERMGHSQLLTAQRYLHTLPDADEQALAAFERIRSRHLPSTAEADDEGSEAALASPLDEQDESAAGLVTRRGRAG